MLQSVICHVYCMCTHTVTHSCHHTFYFRDWNPQPFLLCFAPSDSSVVFC